MRLYVTSRAGLVRAFKKQGTRVHVGIFLVSFVRRAATLRLRAWGSRWCSVVALKADEAHWRSPCAAVDPRERMAHQWSVRPHQSNLADWVFGGDDTSGDSGTGRRASLQFLKRGGRREGWVMEIVDNVDII
jgi:hypothetical protein